MGKIRKGNPDFALGKNVVGGNSWLRVRDVVALTERSRSVSGAVHGLIEDNSPASLPRERLPRTRFRERIKNVQGQGRNFSGERVSAVTMSGVDVRDSCLDDSNFVASALYNVDASGASLRDARFIKCAFGNVMLRGADLTGASFVECSVPPKRVLDLTDSNVTREQIDQLEIERFSPAAESEPENLYDEEIPWAGQIEYRKYQPDDIVAEFDIDREALLVLLWSQDTEVRDDFSYKVVSIDEYNPARHHIPQWEVQAMGFERRADQSASQN